MSFSVKEKIAFKLLPRSNECQNGNGEDIFG